MTYTVEIRPAAARQIKKLTTVVQEQVIQQLEELELDPRPPDVKKLSGKNNLYRVRVGEGAIAFLRGKQHKKRDQASYLPHTFVI